MDYQNIEGPRPEMVQEASQSDAHGLEREIDFSAVMESKENSVNDGDLSRIQFMDPVRSFNVPDGWTGDVEMPSMNTVMANVSYYPPETSDTTLSFFYRGFPIADGEAAKFRDLLSGEPHILNTREIEAIKGQVVGNLGDESAFTITSAATRELAGKRALQINGRWKTSGKRFHGYLVPKDESYRNIQEIFFEGKEPNYSRHLETATSAMTSIKWQESEARATP